MVKSYKDWYAENKISVSDRRKKRYREDPEYRERVRVANQRSHQIRKERSSDVKHPKQYFIEVDGKRVQAYPLSILAEQLECSVQTVRSWERHNRLPPPSHKTPNGVRLYTQVYIDTLRAQLVKSGRIMSFEERYKSRARIGTIRLVNGEVITSPLYTTGYISRAIRTQLTYVVSLEAQGILPKTPLRKMEASPRLYTEDMIAVIRAAYSVNGSLRTPIYREEFAEAVRLGWTRLGILGPGTQVAELLGYEQRGDKSENVESRNKDNTERPESHDRVN